MGDLKIIQYYLTKNPCYNAGRKITPSGIVVHSTGANNPNLKRYIGPDDGILGKNQYGNHWNSDKADKCVHAFIGKAADGTVRIYQTLPWDMRSWGVGKGKNGSHNDTHIQFEICEDGLQDEAYYRECFTLAAGLCAHLCREYGISPENVIGHYESHDMGYGSNHGDPRHWQKKFGGSMDSFRGDVKVLLEGAEKPPETLVSAPKEDSTIKVETPEKGQNGAQTGGVTYTMETLRKRSRGTQVKVLQYLLDLNGFYPGKIDGIFGANTENALMAYQDANGLKVDGIAGKNTWAKIMA